MEHDSIGALNVPAEAYYGVQSMRAATNFQITHRPLHPVLIDSIVMVKKAAAITNEKSGKLDQQIVQAIIQACDEILEYSYAAEPPVQFRLSHLSRRSEPL